MFFIDPLNKNSGAATDLMCIISTHLYYSDTNLLNHILN